ncbi:DNA translocase FtsK [Chloroflexota bacterium]
MAQAPESVQRPDWFDAVVKLLMRLRRFGRDVGGILLMALASLTLLALIGGTSGAWVTPWAEGIKRWFGWGSILLVAALAVGGLLLLQRSREPFTGKDWGRVIALELSAFAIVAMLTLFGGVSLERALAGKDGGLVGWGIVEFLGIILGLLPPVVAGTIRFLLLLVIFVLGGLFGLGLFGQALKGLEQRLLSEPASTAEPIHIQQAVSVGAMPSQKKTAAEQRAGRQRVQIPREHRKTFKVEDAEDDRVTGPLERDDRLPALEILALGKDFKPSERHINQSAGLIEKTLAEFGVPAKVIGFKVGPTITQFAIEPGYLDKGNGEKDEQRQKIRVSQIAGLQKDLALALSAERLRIQAPVPGRAYIGIEVPNKQSALVRLRPILETETFHKLSSPLSIALGRDVSGHPVAADLARMPHLLIAGTTGSGKSVCIAALTICLAMNNTPDTLRIVMIDPKMVELVRFNGLPHLYGKVETDLERIAGVLRWVVIEMQNRYKLLEDLRARDIESFNRKVRRRKEYEPMPRIVVMIDELADLMMNAAEATETTVVRLAQMARAVGIHLVVATQRPSTDVVTGLIKANFPARLSFAVASGVDSRVILDGPGAETLLGRGDMLFLGPEGGSPIRAQGVMVSDQEIENVISYWQQTWQPDDLPDGPGAPWELMLERQEILADRDDLILDAIALIKQTGRASASMFQRQLRIGYPRAARLVDELEDMGVLGPSRGGGREREILINIDREEEQEY